MNASAYEASTDDAETLLSTEAEDCRELLLTGDAPYRAPWHTTVHPWCEALSNLGNEALERFIVDTDYLSLSRQASIYCGDLTGVFRGCPNLRFALVIGCAELSALAHDRLEHLSMIAEPLTVRTIDAVLKGRCPRLRRLALGFRYEGPAAEGADAALLAGLDSAKLRSLTELYIAEPNDGGALLERLVALPIISQLRVLYIRRNVFDDEERVIAILQQHRARLSHLEALYLPVEDAMDYDDVMLAEICPALRGTDGVDPFENER